jgi:hypothetical protein
MVDKVALGRVSSEYFGFPCQSSFHQILHHHNQPGLATIGQSVAAVPSEPSWTQPLHPQLSEQLAIILLQDAEYFLKCLANSPPMHDNRVLTAVLT